MQISAAATAVTTILPTRSAAPAVIATANDPATAVSQTPVAPADPTPAPTDPLPIDPPRRAHGLLRNLAAGHFRGVAELRHRMNFAEEIAAAGIKLPEPTLAKGSGKAYERLLAAYQAQTQPARDTDSLDAAA